uniref:Transmembrane protein n=1 Tax=Nelumbo nucifera TaxID=4432 RepID=A0A822YKW7_NELNU|nr:TPA_asm: hypothetical protein HUJ06_011072 [Nelumbo nucifera]
MASKRHLIFGILVIGILLFSFEVVAREMADMQTRTSQVPYCGNVPHTFPWECP